MKKKLLILIPSYNVEKFLHSLLTSIPFKKLEKFDVEVLIINDASDDKTQSIAEKYKSGNKNFLKIKNSPLYMTYNVNYGLSLNKYLVPSHWFSEKKENYEFYFERIILMITGLEIISGGLVI